MIVEYLCYTIDADRQQQFIHDYTAASEPLLRSEYCESFDMCQCVEDSAEFIIRIHWTSADDHMQKFRSSAEFREFLAHIKAYIGDIKEMRHYQQCLAKS